MLLLILVIEVLILSRLDKVSFGTWFTPFNILAWPYVIVVLLAFFFGPWLGYVPIFMESVLVWIVGLFLFWLGGLLIALPAGSAIRARFKVSTPFLYEERSKGFVLLLAWVCILVLGSRLLTLGGFVALAREDFAVAYVSGWAGHVMTVGFLMLTVLIGIAHKKDWTTWLTILVLLAMIVLYQTKTWVFMPVVAGLIYRATSGRFKLSVSKVLWAFLVVAVLFSLPYLIGFGAGNRETLSDIETYRFLLRHTGNYIFAGVLSWGETVRQGTRPLHSEPTYILGPFVNLYRVVVSGRLISDVSSYFSIIDRTGTIDSNVHTFFGTILLYMGWLSTAALVVWLGVLLYGLFALAVAKRNCWIAAAWSFLAAGLAFGWFDYYYRSLAFVEVAAYGVALAAIAWLIWKSARLQRCPPLAARMLRGFRGNWAPGREGP